MRKIIIPIVLATLLAGCVSDKKLSGYVCAHQVSVTYTANTAISAAEKIKDPVAQKAAIDGANALLNEVAACPPSA